MNRVVKRNSNFWESALFFVLFLGAAQCFAGLAPYDCDEKICNIFIFEKISEEDAALMEAFIEKVHKEKPDVDFAFMMVDSQGGSIDAAFKIGRLARKNQMLVYVPQDAACLSSCIYILVGGVVRVIEGQVGIHTPYFPKETDGSYATNKAKFDALKFRVESYLKEMNMPTSLYDDMLRVPSYKVKILTDLELGNYGFFSKDPVYRETVEIRGAQKLGITREEYIKREQLSDKVCLPLSYQGDTKGYAECLYRIMGHND